MVVMSAYAANHREFGRDREELLQRRWNLIATPRDPCFEARRGIQQIGVTYARTRKMA